MAHIKLEESKYNSDSEEASTCSNESTYDEVTKAVGPIGRWQVRIFVLATLTAAVCSWHMLAISFYAPSAEHWCKPPPLYNNMTKEDWKKYSIPPDHKKPEQFSHCLMYERDYDLLPHEQPEGNLSTVKCKYGWDFDTTQFVRTIENEWDLVCDREPLAKTGASAFFVGVLIGVIFFGQVSDKLGRKTTLLITVCLTVSAGVITAFMPTLEAFFFTRFFVALGAIGAYTTGFVLSMEVVEGKWRTVMGIGTQVPWCLGYISLSGIAYLITDWRYMQLAISVPVVLLVSYWWILPESPRWLLAQGRRTEAHQILEAGAKENRREISPQLTSELLNPEKHGINEVKEGATIVDLFRYPTLRLRALNLFFNWFVNAFAYYGLSLGTNNLGGNIFVNFFLGGAIELPAYALTIYLLMKKGRRIPHCIFMVIGGLACLGTLGFEKGTYAFDWPIVTLAMTGKFCISASFAIVYVFSAEIFPTVVRNVGVGSSSMFARLGSVIAPYVDLARHFHPAIPLVIYGSCSILAGLLTLLLPETNNKPLPQTLEEAERFGRKARC